MRHLSELESIDPIERPAWLKGASTDQRIAYYLHAALKPDVSGDLLAAFLRLGVLEGWL